jgi:hypothetical protein
MRLNPYSDSAYEAKSVNENSIQSLPNGAKLYLVHPIQGIREVNFIPPIKLHSVYQEKFFNVWTKNKLEIIPIVCYEYGITSMRFSLGRIFTNSDDANEFFDEMTSNSKIKNKIIRFMKEESKI